ncbi:hypothetical protein [Sphingomonas jatrophae]|uniref:Uncharacterized protein n=1 Tax=Sphingomonas jatrophae TaxID=1166337 RepID=A0A1I6JR40_9SPHN|nr:hypothetical protein [Sphingomonas jatrophae]SFR81442.1 hypothetical protein SAMN05192580_0705 [Sphingomonas jatrophae]
MARNYIGGLIGGVAGGLVLYLVGFIFWGTPLSALAYSSIDDAGSASLRAALAQTLTASGTGTYIIPNPATDQGTVLFGQGPIATVHFNTSGFPVIDTSSLVAGLFLALFTGVLIAAALRVIAPRVTDFPSRARVAVLFALAISLYLDLGQPILNHYGPGYFIYTFLGDFLGLAAAGLVIARFFLPRAAASSVEQV